MEPMLDKGWHTGLSAFDKIRIFHDPADAPKAEQHSNRLDNRHYAKKIMEMAGSVKGKTILFLGMGQEEAAYLLAERGASVVYGTWSEKALAFAQKTVTPDYAPVAGRVVFRLVDPRLPEGFAGSYDVIVVMKAAKQLRPGEFAGLMRSFVGKPLAEPRIVLHTSPNAALTGPAFFLARIVSGRRRWKSRQYGFREQSYFSWRRMLVQLGRPYILMTERQPRFFSRQVLYQTGMSGFIRRMAILADRILDSAPMLRLRGHSVLSPFLSTDLWAVVGELDP
jgi:hypothetical protein